MQADQKKYVLILKGVGHRPLPAAKDPDEPDCRHWARGISVSTGMMGESVCIPTCAYTCREEFAGELGFLGEEQ